MSKHNAKIFSESDVRNAIADGKSMRRAAQLLNIDSRTFKKNAEMYGCYDSSQRGGGKYALSDILAGQYPQYPTSKLSKRLVKEGYKSYTCEKCGISEYNGTHISLELNHKDGNNANHSLDNLELLCPNCHSQTPTYRSKKLIFMK